MRLASESRSVVITKSRDLDAVDVYDPLVGSSSPQMRLRSVDFPEPDGPMTATRSPLPIVEIGQGTNVF